MAHGEGRGSWDSLITTKLTQTLRVSWYLMLRYRSKIWNRCINIVQSQEDSRRLRVLSIRGAPGAIRGTFEGLNLGLPFEPNKFGVLGEFNGTGHTGPSEFCATSI